MHRVLAQHPEPCPASPSPLGQIPPVSPSAPCPVLCTSLWALGQLSWLCPSLPRQPGSLRSPWLSVSTAQQQLSHQAVINRSHPEPKHSSETAPGNNKLSQPKSRTHRSCLLFPVQLPPAMPPVSLTASCPLQGPARCRIIKEPQH